MAEEERCADPGQGGDVGSEGKEEELLGRLEKKLGKTKDDLRKLMAKV